MKRGVFEANVSLEFASEEDAVFAQVVLDGCCKNGKMVVWTTESEKVTMPAPVARQSIKMSVVHTNSSARVGGQSSVNYLTVPGTHFFVPGQTVFVNNSVIVEDVTWLGGANDTDWVWKAVAMTASSHVKSPTALGIGAKDELHHKYKAAQLKRIVYLKVSIVVLLFCLSFCENRFCTVGSLSHCVCVCSMCAMRPSRRSSTRLGASIWVSRSVASFWTLATTLCAHCPRRASRVAAT